MVHIIHAGQTFIEISEINLRPFNQEKGCKHFIKKVDKNRFKGNVNTIDKDEDEGMRSRQVGRAVELTMGKQWSTYLPRKWERREKVVMVHNFDSAENSQGPCYLVFLT